MFGFFFIVNFALSGFKKALEKEKNLARVDSLTGVANSRYFFDLAEKEIERSRRYRHPLTLLYLDCDNFKNLNDNFGHQIGNRLLHLLATILQNNTRTTDIVARLGGDEFAILMPETGEQIVPQAIQRLHTRLVDALRKKGWPVTLSMGAAIYLHPPASADELIKSADRLMLQAKSEGKNRVRYKIFGELEVSPQPDLPADPSIRSLRSLHQEDTCRLFDRNFWSEWSSNREKSRPNSSAQSFPRRPKITGWVNSVCPNSSGIRRSFKLRGCCLIHSPRSPAGYAPTWHFPPAEPDGLLLRLQL